MNKNKAIKIINTQIEKLKSSKDNRNESWTIETQTYIIHFFGKDSHQNDFFKYYSWSLQPDFDPDVQEKETIIFLNDCINTIKNVGLYKEPKINFLNQLSDSIIVLILTTIGIVSFGLGKYISDVQNIELKIENENYKKLSITPTNTDTNKAPKNTNKVKN